MSFITRNKDLIVESGIQLIPYIGGSLATLYFGEKQEKRFKRLENFYLEISEEINSIKENLANIETHNSEELSAIIEILNENVESEHLQSKLKYYKNYFKNTLCYPVNGNYDERKLYLDILFSLSPLQIAVFIYLNNEKNGAWVDFIRMKGVDNSLLRACVKVLDSYGLVDMKNERMGGGIIGNQPSESVKVCDFGKRFHDFCIA